MRQAVRRVVIVLVLPPLGCLSASSAGEVFLFLDASSRATYIYDLARGAHAGATAPEGTLELRYGAPCGAGCVTVQRTTRIKGLPDSSEQRRIYVHQGNLLESAATSGGRTETDTILIREPLRRGSSWERRGWYGTPISQTQVRGADGRAQTLAEIGTPSDLIMTCRISDVGEKVVLESRRRVVTVTCEPRLAPTDVSVTVVEEYAEQLGLVAAKETFGGRDRQVIGYRIATLRQVVQPQSRSTGFKAPSRTAALPTQ